MVDTCCYRAAIIERSYSSPVGGGGWRGAGTANGSPYYCCCCCWQDMVGSGDGEGDDNLYSIDPSSSRATV